MIHPEASIDECMQEISALEAEVERLHLIVASAAHFLVEHGYTVEAAKLRDRRALEPKP